jgi:hypothetical protein
MKTSESVLCGEIIGICSEIRTEDTDTLCGQNVEFLYTNPEDT